MGILHDNVDKSKDPKKAQTVHYQWNIEVDKLEEYFVDEDIDFRDPMDMMIQIARTNNTDSFLAECSLRKEKGHVAGKVHYQGYLKLAKKQSLNGVLKSNSWLIKCLVAKGHIMYSHAKNDGYLDKISTGLSPKVRMKDAKEPPKLRKNYQAHFMQNQIDNDELFTWQEDLMNEVGELLHTPRDWQHWMRNPLLCRKVSIICDPEGGTGKSMLQNYLKCTERLYYQLPALPEGQAVNQFITSMLKDRPQKYLPKVVGINWSRAFSGNMNKKAVLGFFMGVEAIKDGETYDTRYQGTKLEFDFAPAVYVFCNEIPSYMMTALSQNRWNIRYIVKAGPAIGDAQDYEFSNNPPLPAGQVDVDDDDLAGGFMPPPFDPAQMAGMHHVQREEDAEAGEGEAGSAAEEDDDQEDDGRERCAFVNDEAHVPPAKRRRKK